MQSRSLDCSRRWFQKGSTSTTCLQSQQHRTIRYINVGIIPLSVLLLTSLANKKQNFRRILIEIHAMYQCLFYVKIHFGLQCLVFISILYAKSDSLSETFYVKPASICYDTAAPCFFNVLNIYHYFFP